MSLFDDLDVLSAAALEVPVEEYIEKIERASYELAEEILLLLLEKGDIEAGKALFKTIK